MANPESISEELLRFFDANVESIEQLEILRILGEDPAREWSDAEMAAASQTPPAQIAGHLTVLESRGLLQLRRESNQLHCRYGTASASQEKMMSGLLLLYKQRPATLIRLVYTRGSDRLKAFADAFRLRKDG